MNNSLRKLKNPLFFIVVLLLLVASIPILNTKVDRISANLKPDEGIINGQVLKKATSYRQSFLVNTKNISKIGFHLRYTVTTPPIGNLSINILRNKQIIFSQTVNSSLIDSAGPTYVKINPPIKTSPGEKLSAEILVSKELNQVLRAQHRHLDKSFNPKTTTFYINDVQQPSPLAYQTLYSHTPPLALQLGCLLIFTSLAALLIKIFKLPQELFTHPFSSIILKKISPGKRTAFALLILSYVLTAPALFLFSIKGNANQLLTIYFYSVAVLSLFIFISCKKNLAMVPALFGSHALAFSSWYPLQVLSSKPRLAVITIALLFIVALLPIRKTAPQFSALSSSLLLIILLLLIKLSFIEPGVTSNVRDIFLDPNQSIMADKKNSLSWNNYGSYIGIIPAFFAFAGIFFHHKKFLPVLTIGLVGLALATISPITAFFNQFFPLPGQNLSILITMSLSFFAAIGLQSSMNFFNPGKYKFQSGLILLLFSLITIISLLDIWHVSATIR